MKFSFLLFAFLIIGCKQSDRGYRPYPGTNFASDCGALWEAGYDINVEKCEADLRNPKYKLGEKIRLEEYDKSCNVVIVNNRQWTYKKNEVLYEFDADCGGRKMSGKIRESEILK